MLAAKTAWAILESEHAHMRRLLASMSPLLGTDDWCVPGAAQARLRELIETLQTFDRTSHRPKGVAMLNAMSGRSPPADRQLATLQDERARGDALLREATAALDAIAAGDATVCDNCRAMLNRYRDGMLAQMEQEETLLRAHAERLLTEEEWSRVVSYISSTLYAAGQRSDDIAGEH